MSYKSILQFTIKISYKSEVSENHVDVRGVPPLVVVTVVVGGISSNLYGVYGYP